MNTIQEQEVISFEDSIRRHLYFSMIEVKKNFLDFESENLYWAFNDVDRQLCIALFGKAGSEGLSENEIYEIIDGRRTNAVDLIAYKDTASAAFLQQSSFTKTASIFYNLFDTDGLSAENVLAADGFNLKNIDGSEDLKAMLKAYPEFPAENTIEGLDSLFTKPYFSALSFANDKVGDTTLALLCFSFEDLVVAELLELSGLASDHMEMIIESLKIKLNINNKPLLLVTTKDIIPVLGKETPYASIVLDHFTCIGKIKKEEVPVTMPLCGVLKKKLDYFESLYYLSQSGLPKHNDLPKNWDSFAALSAIMNHTAVNRKSNILDAGGEYYSAIMHQLASFDFENLYCINTVFKKPSSIGRIKYIPGDVTATDFEDKTFKAITCLSVIEHGVNIEMFFAESSRILTDDGLLFISTDYWNTPVKTDGKEAYGVPVKIFDQQNMEQMVLTAEKYGLYLAEPINYKCGHKVVQWEEMRYTFIYLTFYKKAQ
ncbi:MAG: Methyltransferase type 11 [Mucilaginibacter sp.]|nr:Methyltransferase type 11 [Mucilaginibacter sp.]